MAQRAFYGSPRRGVDKWFVLRYIRVMNYLESLRAMTVHLLELESLFHGIFSVDVLQDKDKVTSIKRYKVLKVIETDGPQNLTVLCRRFHMRKNSCSELLDRMLKDELVERTPSDTDRRKIYFHLTGKGTELIGNFEERFAERISTLFKDLPGNEVNEFMDALKTMVTVAKKISV